MYLQLMYICIICYTVDKFGPSLKMPHPPSQHARDNWVRLTRQLLGQRPRIRRGGRRCRNHYPSHGPAPESVPLSKVGAATMRPAHFKPYVTMSVHQALGF